MGQLVGLARGRKQKAKQLPYFFILPLYVGFVLAALLSGYLLRFTRLRVVAPYVIGGVLGSVPGLVAAHALLLLSLVGRTPATTENAQLAKGVLAGALVFLGPFVVSAAGIFLGMVGGVYAVWRIRQRRRG